MSDRDRQPPPGGPDSRRPEVGTGPRKTPPTPSPSRYVSIGFAAHRASVSKDTIRRMIADGTLPAYRFRGQIRIAIDDIDKAMRPLA
ncbi:MULTISPECIES: excisionase family DNA-binding protein [Nocardia]|uniref:excisionase family DNA-binding protein n=1 Tax=Nocardia TaxID=1817 RepID=UPI000D68E2D8|nr:MULTISPECIES: excisionase family DNA-binding protein [Nocardia]